MFLKIYIPKDSIASYSAMKTHGKNWQKLFIREETQMTTKPMKRCSAPRVERKMSVETILNYHFTLFHLKMFFSTLYISSPWLIYFVIESLYLLTSLTYFSPPLWQLPVCSLSVSMTLFPFCCKCSFVLIFRFYT